MPAFRLGVSTSVSRLAREKKKNEFRQLLAEVWTDLINEREKFRRAEVAKNLLCAELEDT